MIDDDGDIVRGLGFVSMYSAWVEEDVDDILRLLESIEPFDEKKQRWPISLKLKHTTELIRRLNSQEIDELPAALEVGINLFEERNQVIHGRIYAGYDKKEYVKPGRPHMTTRPITSAELYQLANDLMSYRGYLLGPQIFRLPRAIAKFTNGES